MNEIVFTGFADEIILSLMMKYFLQLHLDCRSDHCSRNLSSVLFPDLSQLLLHKPVQDSVFLTNIVSHHRLPVWVSFVLAAWFWTNVRFLGWQLSCDPLLEVVPGQVVLQVSVKILGCGLELADGADLNSILPRVSRNSHKRTM